MEERADFDFVDVDESSTEVLLGYSHFTVFEELLGFLHSLYGFFAENFRATIGVGESDDDLIECGNFDMASLSD